MELSLSSSATSLTVPLQSMVERSIVLGMLSFLSEAVSSLHAQLPIGEVLSMSIPKQRF